MQAIVATRLSDEAASALRGFTFVDRHALGRSQEGQHLLAAFHTAEKDLQRWCAQGLVGARGRKTIGFHGHCATEPEDLADWWGNRRHLDIEKGALRGSPSFLEVELRRDDVRRLVTAGMPGVESLLKWTPALPPSGKVSATSERTAGILLDIFPNKPPTVVECSDSEVYNKFIKKWDNKPNAPSKETILRVLGRRKWPVQGD